jgi:transposase
LKIIKDSMRDTSLYEQLLGLKSPWPVRSVDLSLTDQRVVVEVVLEDAKVWADPTDATKRAHINGWSEHQWRHLDACQFETFIKTRIAQLKYSDATLEELSVPWAERYSRVTTLMAGFVIKLFEACPSTQAVCTLTRLFWSTVSAIMVSAVERGMLRRTEQEIAYLGIDEKSFERRRTYVSMLIDMDRSRVLELVPERKLEASLGLLETCRAWCIKENFSHFWSYSCKSAAKRFFKAHANNAMRSKLEPVKKVVKMIRRYGKGLLNFSQHRISNACTEGFNSAIQLIKANARGFRNFTNYRARILFHCGKLNLAMG